MYKVILFFLFVLVSSCGEKKDVLLPKSDVSVVADVRDHSPIYIFFKIDKKDTVADVNRKNSIISTNWLFNIDKRLPLKVVFPEVIKLQNKKREEKAHKNEKAENYYSYADSISKNLAFFPFTKVYYKMEKPNQQKIFYFSKNKSVSYNGKIISNEELLLKMDSVSRNKNSKLVIAFDKNLDFGSYLQFKIRVKDYFAADENSEEFIY